MNDTLQVVIVTLVALAALIVLLRPLFAREKSGPSKAGGCANCASAPQQPARRV
jgi:hypothetical protein